MRLIRLIDELVGLASERPKMTDEEFNRVRLLDVQIRQACKKAGLEFPAELVTAPRCLGPRALGPQPATIIYEYDRQFGATRLPIRDWYGRIAIVPTDDWKHAMLLLRCEVAGEDDSPPAWHKDSGHDVETCLNELLKHNPECIGWGLRGLGSATGYSHTRVQKTNWWRRVMANREAARQEAVRRAEWGG